MEHVVVRGGEQWLPFARHRVAILKALGLPYAVQVYEVEHATITVRVVPGYEYIRIDGWVDMLSGAARLNTDDTAEFRATPNTAFVLPLYQAEKFQQKDPFWRGYWSKPASAFSGLMSKAVQAIHGYLPFSQALAFDSGFYRCHGLHRDKNGKLWVIEIDSDNGVLAMPLRLHRHNPKDAHAKLVADMFGGGLPANRAPPTDPEQLANAIAEGRVIVLATVGEMQPYFGKSEYSTYMGWSFDDTGASAYNTCHTTINYVDTSFLYRLDISITPRDPAVEDSLDTGTATLVEMGSGPLDYWNADGITEEGGPVAPPIPWRVNGRSITYYGTSYDRFHPRTDFDGEGIGNGQVPTKKAKEFKGSRTPVFVCHIDGQLEIVYVVCDPYKAPTGDGPLYWPAVAHSRAVLDPYNMCQRLESVHLPKDVPGEMVVTTTDERYIDPVYGDEYYHKIRWSVKGIAEADKNVRLQFVDYQTALNYVRDTVSDVYLDGHPFGIGLGESMWYGNVTLIPAIEILCIEYGGNIYTRTERTSFATEGRTYGAWSPTTRDGYIATTSPPETATFERHGYAGMRFVTGRRGERNDPNDRTGELEFPPVACEHAWAVEFRAYLGHTLGGAEDMFGYTLETTTRGKRTPEYPFVENNVDKGVDVYAPEAPPSAFMRGEWGATGGGLVSYAGSIKMKSGGYGHIAPAGYVWRSEIETPEVTINDGGEEGWDVPGSDVYGEYGAENRILKDVFDRILSALRPNSWISDIWLGGITSVYSELTLESMYVSINTVPHTQGIYGPTGEYEDLGVYTLPARTPPDPTFEYTADGIAWVVASGGQTPPTEVTGWKKYGTATPPKSRLLDYEFDWQDTYGRYGRTLVISTLGTDLHTALPKFLPTSRATRLDLNGTLIEQEAEDSEATYRFIGYIDTKKTGA